MFLLSPERFLFSLLFFFFLFLLMIVHLKADSWRLLSELSGFPSLQFLRLRNQPPLNGPVLHCPVPQPCKGAALCSWRPYSFMLQMVPFKYTGSIASVLVSGCCPDVSSVTFDLPVGDNGSHPWLHNGSHLEGCIKHLCLGPAAQILM